MPTIRLILVLLAMSSSVVAADMRSGNISTDSEIRLGIGYLNGKASSFFYDVYGVTFGTPGYKIRETDWKFDSIPMYGIGYSLGIGKSIRFNLDYWGNAGDGDANADYYSWGLVGSDWSASSNHGNTSVSTIQLIDISGEYTFSTSGKRGARDSWSAVVGYRNDAFDAQARGGSGILTTTSFRDTNVIYPDSPMLSYKQTLSVPYLGLRYISNTRSKKDKYKVVLTMLYSVLARGEDTFIDHRSNQKYEEEGSGGEWSKITLEVDYEITKHMMFTIGYSKQNYMELKGTLLNTDITNSSTALYPDKTASMSNKTDLISLGINYRF